MDLNTPAIIVAITGLVSLAASIWSARAGRADGRTQQMAANELARRSQEWEEQQQTLKDQAYQLDRVRAERDWYEHRGDAFREALVTAELTPPKVTPLVYPKRGE